jgi:endonuclease/exonuclease/phosphatase (EEP) superfamily protein YafD
MLNASSSASASHPAASGKWRRLSSLVLATSWVYVVFLATLWAVLYLWGDSWWFATLLLFGPRWVSAIPLAVLVPGALFLRRRALGLNLLAAGLVIGPIMGFCLPWQTFLQASGRGPAIRVLTFNGHDDKFNPAAFSDVVAFAKPDMIVLQVVKKSDSSRLFGHAPWHFAGDGEHSLVSRFPIQKVDDIARDPIHARFVERFDVETPAGVVHVLDVHLTSPHTAFEKTLGGESTSADQIAANNAQRDREMQFLWGYTQSLGGSVIIAGDFNTPCESPAFRRNLGAFANAFTVAGTGFGWTYHFGGTISRIDHILVTPDWQFRRCRVGPNIGSPHRPVIADLERRSP